jgi:hypothetical protein
MQPKYNHILYIPNHHFEDYYLKNIYFHRSIIRNFRMLLLYRRLSSIKSYFVADKF